MDIPGIIFCVALLAALVLATPKNLLKEWGKE